MHRYIIKRILLIIPVVFFVSFIIFWLLDLAPGDAAYILATDEMTDEEIETLREVMGLNDPVIQRYLRYIAGVARGDLGTSIRSGAPVWDQYIARFPTTAKLALASELVTVIIAIPLGILAARKKDSWIDFGATTFNLLGLSIPNFWLGLLLILWFAVRHDWFPASGNEGWISYVLPAIVIGTGHTAVLGRTTRSAMLDVLRQDYLRTARAKGCSERTVVNKHAFRNALIPISTIFFNQLGGLFGGAVTTEAIFALPGVAQMSVQAIRNNDYAMVTGSSIMTTTIITSFVVILDIFIAYIDPRVKAQYSK
jgi:peptide/nickel transport system permease protein